jgi:alpha-ribazole phosphatase
LGTPLKIDERLREMDHGEWEGRSWKEIEGTDGDRLTAWMADWIGGRPPGGESLGEIEHRVAAWLADLGPEPVVAVAHAGVIRAMWVLLEGLSWPEAIARDVQHLEPVVFGQ